MKNILITCLILLSVLLIGGNNYGQESATATWSLYTNQTVSASGNVSATNQTAGSQFTEISYRTSPSHQRQTYMATPSYNENSFVQYTISPSSGYNAVINSIKMRISSSGGGSNGKAAIYYSLSSDFSDPVALTYTSSVPYSMPSTHPATDNIDLMVNINVNNGSTFYLRVYGWYTSSATKHLGSSDVVISCSTTVAGTPPTVTTAFISNIGVTTATGGGNVTDGGSASVTARGVCWSTSETPTIADSKTEDGTSTGEFTSSLTGLTSNTTYYVRAYAINSAGTSYGDQVSFTTLAGTPDIALSSSNPAVAAGSMGRGLVKGVLYKFTLAVTTASATLQQVGFTTSGTYAEEDITKFQLWYNTSDNFGSSTQLGDDISTSLGTGAHSFSSLNQAIAANATGYLWITTNVAETATLDNNISVAAVTTADITFASGNKSGTAYAGGSQTFIAPSNATDHFRSKQTGNWSDASTWESSSDGSSWIPATLTPTDEANTIIIRNEHEVTVTASVSVDQVTIQSGGQVTVNFGQIFTITNGADDVDFQVNGTLKNSGTVTPTGALAFGDGGVYEHLQNGGSIPLSTWGTGSTCLVTGATGSSPSNNAQAFYNFVWNCTSQSSNLNLVWGVSSVTTITGNLTVTNTGNSEFRLTNSSIANDININGNFIINSSSANFKISGSASTGLKNINIGGDIIVTGGTFAISGHSAANFSWNVSGDVSLSNTTLTKSSSETVSKLVFNNNGNQNLTIGSGTTFSSGFPLEVSASSTLNYGASVFSGTGSFTLNSGATVITSHANGLNGNITTSGAKTLSSSANYTYNGSVAQVTGTLLPTTVNNLTINNSANVTLSNNLTVNGTLLKQAGDLLLDDKTLSFGASASTGVVQIINNQSNVNVGDLGALISSGANLGSTTVTRGLYALSGNSNNGIKRWYKISPTNNTGLDATLVFPYNDDVDELNGIAEGSLRLFKSTDDGITWTMITANVTHDAEANTFTVTSLDGFSTWTLGDVGSPLPVELTSLTANVQGKVVSIKWETATEIDNFGFEIERSKGSNNSDWVNVGFVKGNGNSNSVNVYSYTDKTISQSGNYSYRLKQIDNSGSYKYYDAIEVDVKIPLTYGVSQNYPNPFNPSTRIEYQIPVKGNVVIKLYDVIGNQVMTLMNEDKEAGVYTIDFDGKQLSNGVYFYQIRSGEFVQTKKMTLIK